VKPTQASEREPNGRSRGVLSIAAPLGFGIVGVAVLGVMAIALPAPTPFQFAVFRTLLALAGSGVAASLPGFLSIGGSRVALGLIRAGGAIAVFVLIYMFAAPHSIR
jgi:hypothetical protein